MILQFGHVSQWLSFRILMSAAWQDQASWHTPRNVAVLYLTLPDRIRIGYIIYFEYIVKLYNAISQSYQFPNLADLPTLSSLGSHSQL